MTISIRDVNKRLRSVLWPRLVDYGFHERTDRVAWRYWEEGVDVVEVQSVGSDYDHLGCTSFSLAAYVAGSPFWLRPPHGLPHKDGQPRPHYWHCDPLMRKLTKSLKQPWFAQFTQPPAILTQPMRIHREGLRRVLRSDVHDRPDVWFVLDDGSNLEEVVDDLSRAVITDGRAFLERTHDAAMVLNMLSGRELRLGSGSPAEIAVVAAAEARLRRPNSDPSVN